MEVSGGRTRADDTGAGAPIGQTLGGRYRVKELLAIGGVARVYLAEDERLLRPVAVKLLGTSRGNDPQFTRAFLAEATTTASLWHPNIVAVFDRGVYLNRPYVVMEYVAGRSLRAILNERGRLPTVQALRLCRQLLSGLEVAHRAGLVHRDIKPENILVAEDGGVKLADFGIACRTQTVREEGPLLATVAYVAPELVSSGTAVPRSDIYSVGIVLFELLTGEVPFDGPDPARVARMHVEQRVPTPSTVLTGVPGMVNALVSRATKRGAAARPRDASALAAEIDSVLRRLHSAPRRFSSQGRRLARTTVITLLLAATAVLGWWFATGVTQQP